TPWANIESERYAVLSALIKDLYLQEGTQLLVIVNGDPCPSASRTNEPRDQRVEEMRRQTEDYAFKKFQELTPDTIESFHSNAKECHPLVRRLDVPVKYVLVRARDLDPFLPKAK